MVSTTLTGLFTSDASLVRCELSRVRGWLTLPGDYVSVGAWNDGMIVQRRYGTGAPRAEVWEVPDTDVVMLASGAAEAPVELNAQPFRFHDWLFGQVGTVAASERVRERLYEQLPEFLQQVVRGHSLAEVVFAQFLAELRVLGRIDDARLEAATVAGVLQSVAKAVEAATLESGATERNELALLASNGHCLAACRAGAQGLSYVLLEGQIECERCELAANAPETDALVRDHRRRRSVVISTQELGPRAVPVSDGSALAISGRAPGESGQLSVKVLPPR